MTLNPFSHSLDFQVHFHDAIIILGLETEQANDL